MLKDLVESFKTLISHSPVYFLIFLLFCIIKLIEQHRQQNEFKSLSKYICVQMLIPKCSYLFSISIKSRFVRLINITNNENAI